MMNMTVKPDEHPSSGSQPGSRVEPVSEVRIAEIREFAEGPTDRWPKRHGDRPIDMIRDCCRAITEKDAEIERLKRVKVSEICAIPTTINEVRLEEHRQQAVKERDSARAECVELREALRESIEHNEIAAEQLTFIIHEKTFRDSIGDAHHAITAFLRNYKGVKADANKVVIDRDRLAELERDRARLDWLEDGQVGVKAGPFEIEIKRRAELRETIDTAMQKGAQG